MPVYSIISTYPARGSRNIGDELIAQSTMKAIRKAKGESVRFNVLWRAAQWQDVERQIKESDAVVFACMAIRNDLATRHYPYLNNVMESGVPFAAISAGTALDVISNGRPILESMSTSTIDALRQFSESALFFTSRGALTQRFCEYNGLSRAFFTGDIAFFDERYDDLAFKRVPVVRKIAISDPHYGEFYKDHLGYLVDCLSREFSGTEISVLLHGVNPQIERFCADRGISYRRIYEDADSGLDAYAGFDLHVGYRVHGHVSALKRAIPSYLLEQDGRGCDYGLTIERRVSVPAYLPAGRRRSSTWRSRLVGGVQCPSLASIDQAMALVGLDRKHDFEKFIGLERQLRCFKHSCYERFFELP